MTYNVIVLYPNEDDTKFDLKYYLDSHMPLVSVRAFTKCSGIL